MKTSIKFATGLILAAAALVASGSAAQAGEGGAAGSVSIKFAGTTTAGPSTSVTNPITGVITTTPGALVPDVSRLSTSVAVGKSFAMATARTTGENTNTSAIGSGGGFGVTGAGVYTGVAETATEQAINQVNTFAVSSPTTLKPTTGVTLAD